MASKFLRNCKEGNLDRVLTYLNSGKDVQVYYTYNPGVKFSPLGIAAFNGHLAVVQALILLEKDMNMENVPDDFYPAIHAAAYVGEIEILEIILNSYKNINVQNKTGQTALQLAASNGKIDTIKYLLSRGAKILLDNSQHSPIDHARNRGHYNVVKLFSDFPQIVTLQTLCLRSILDNDVNTDNQPPLLLKFWDEIKDD